LPERGGAKDAVTLNLFVGDRKDGTPVVEEVPVEPLGGRRYRLRASPGLLEGMAAGDEFETAGTEERPVFRLLRRGGNVSVQFFAAKDSVESCETFLLPRMRALGGRLDGRRENLLVFTIPVAVGFPAIEGVIREGQAAFPGSEWMYGNVYDPADGHTPLNWWQTPG
jgi:hypothetical protein